MPIQRPTWLPSYLPELDGLRGLAILWVVLYHCEPLLQGTWMHRVAEWGWAGVDIFFVLSGFLITANLLAARDKPHYFHNFHARRALRIWPVYVLVLAVVYLNAPWFIGPNASVIGAIKAAPWLAYIFFVQNLFHLSLPSALGPTWALAVEEQYYFFWAPVVRWLGGPKRIWALAAVLACALISSPLLRHLNPVWLWNVPNHTLIKLDGIALGSLMALGLYTIQLRRRVCLWLGLGAFVLGMGAAAAAVGTSLLDTALAACFAGATLALMASTTGVPGDRSSSPGWSTGARNSINVLLSRGPLAFYGRISYGLYMIHIAAFIFIGWFDLRMTSHGMAGSLAVVAARFAVSTALAAALWYGFESQILKLKRYF
jgi:peptidoglycan/LPS O-acetylase OafA/YrhL